MRRNTPANSAHEFEELISTTRTASMRTRGGSAQEQARRVARLDAPPELFLGREQQMLVERISRNGKFNPLAAAGDDRERRHVGVGYPHVVLELRHILFGCRFL